MMETKGIDSHVCLASLIPPDYQSVLVCLILHGNEEGESYISRSDVCQYTDLSRFVVDEAIEWLYCCGCIDIEQSKKTGEFFIIYPEFFY